MNTPTHDYKASYLTRKYEPIIKEYKFDQFHDDRRILLNMYNQLLTACHGMEVIGDAFLRVAFNKAFQEQDSKMEEIVHRFTGQIYKDNRWTDDDPAGHITGKITLDLIKWGYQTCHIGLIEHDNTGIVCSIGEYEFNFDVERTGVMDRQTYTALRSDAEICEAIYEALDSFRTDSPDEYKYYLAYLTESKDLCDAHPAQEITIPILDGMLIARVSWDELLYRESENESERQASSRIDILFAANDNLKKRKYLASVGMADTDEGVDLRAYITDKDARRLNLLGFSADNNDTLEFIWPQDRLNP